MRAFHEQELRLDFSLHSKRGYDIRPQTLPLIAFWAINSKTDRISLGPDKKLAEQLPGSSFVPLNLKTAGEVTCPAGKTMGQPQMVFLSRSSRDH